jgi:hypothetical protein
MTTTTRSGHWRAAPAAGVENGQREQEGNDTDRAVTQEVDEDLLDEYVVDLDQRQVSRHANVDKLVGEATAQTRVGCSHTSSSGCLSRSSFRAPDSRRVI